MSKKTLLALAAATALALPSVAFSQVGIGARAGTLGVGAEASVGLGKMLVLRGGLGMLPFSITGELPKSNKEYTIDFPSNVWTLGVDLYPGAGGFHLSAGILNRPDFDVEGSFSGTVRVGNTDYSGKVDVAATFANDKQIGPYGAIGFGRTNKRGLGFSIDLGAAYMGDGAVDITKATCTQASGASCPAQIPESEVQAEEARLTADLNDKGYLKFHPILSLSLHFGL